MIYSTGVCKPFPPPLVRGGVFLVGSDTKYRVIADGNILNTRYRLLYFIVSDTKYRDIADGNQLLTKYESTTSSAEVGNQVPRYSGWKQSPQVRPDRLKDELETKYRDIADGNIW